MHVFFHSLKRLFQRSPADASTEQERHLLKNIERLERAIGYTIRNRDLFVHALLHRSFTQRTHHVIRSNERLEFLGDSVLNLIVGEYLYHRLPTAEEGELTQRRARLVNRKALAAYGRAIRLADFILMSPSAAQTGKKGGDTITADTFEAIIAAIYLDGGYPAAKRFVESQFEAAVRGGSVTTADDNFKSRLLEYAQSRGLGVPHYSIVGQEGPDHDRTFTVEAALGRTKRGRGAGKNKKEAEQAAAHDVLRQFLPEA